MFPERYETNDGFDRLANNVLLVEGLRQMENFHREPISQLKNLQVTITVHYLDNLPLIVLTAYCPCLLLLN